MLRARLLRSEEDVKKGNVRFEINTWRVFLEVTFGTFYGEKFFWIVNPTVNNDRPPACKIENLVTINCEFSLPRLMKINRRKSGPAKTERISW